MNSHWKDQEPASLWEAFYNITQIPHGSGNEKALLDFIKGQAENLGFSYQFDAAGNLVVRKPAHQGYENKPTVVFQGHVDMVCEKNRDTAHDFTSDPLDVYQEGDWLKARGTTLGADNGIAVASALALMADKEIKHGPLELLFTVEEETGLVGATNLATDMLKGKLLINMDSEEEGEFCVGCAGGKIANGYIPVHWQPAPEGYIPIQISLNGLRGGHSGADIHMGLGNAIVMGSRVLWYLFHQVVFFIAHMEGGDKHNAIPREFFATLMIESTALPRVREFVKNYELILKAESGDREPGLALDVKVLNDMPGEVLTSDKAAKALNLLFSLPNGVISYSREIPGLVETSTNLASIQLNHRDFKVLTSQRSSIMSRRDHVADRIKAAFFASGGAYEVETEYPSWEPVWDSSLVKVFQDVYRNLEHKEAKIGVIHAGLECGIIGSKYPGMEMISFGPDLMGVHTPEEKLSVSSTQRTWTLLKKVLEKL